MEIDIVASLWASPRLPLAHIYQRTTPLVLHTGPPPCEGLVLVARHSQQPLLPSGARSGENMERRGRNCMWDPDAAAYNYEEKRKEVTININACPWSYAKSLSDKLLLWTNVELHVSFLKVLPPKLIMRGRWVQVCRTKEHFCHYVCRIVLFRSADGLFVKRHIAPLCRAFREYSWSDKAFVQI